MCFYFFNTIKKMKTHHLFLIKQSRIYIVYLLLLHFYAFLSIDMIAPHFLYPIFLCISFISFCRYAFHNTFISLAYDKKRDWLIIKKNNEIIHAELLTSSVLLRHCIILHFQIKHSKTKKCICFFSDHFSNDNFQTVRRHMKMGFL